MKIQVLHDSAGAVRGFLVVPPGERKGFLVPGRPDRFVTEVEVSDLDIEMTRENQGRVAEALEQRLIGSKVTAGRLVRQDDAR